MRFMNCKTIAQCVDAGRHPPRELGWGVPLPSPPEKCIPKNVSRKMYPVEERGSEGAHRDALEERAPRSLGGRVRIDDEEEDREHDEGEARETQQHFSTGH